MSKQEQRIVVKRTKVGFEYHFKQSTNTQDWKVATLEHAVFEMRAEGFLIPEIRTQVIRAHAESAGSSDMAKFFISAVVGAGHARKHLG